jgi:hypothetical protein
MPQTGFGLFGFFTGLFWFVCNKDTFASKSEQKKKEVWFAIKKHPLNSVCGGRQTEQATTDNKAGEMCFSYIFI